MSTLSDFRPKFTHRHLIGCLAIISVAVLVLSGMGRSIWCSCGQLTLWSSEIQSLHNSQHLIDQYTFTHILHGLSLYALLWLLLQKWVGPLSRGVLAIGLESFWEILENTSMVIDKYREVTVSYGYYGDSIANSVGDILACGLGYCLAMGLPVWVSTAGFFIIEGILLWWIRDGLLLNLLMLLWPIEAIRNWQMEETKAAATWIAGLPKGLLRRVLRPPLWLRCAFRSDSQCDPDDSTVP